MLYGELACSVSSVCTYFSHECIAFSCAVVHLLLISDSSVFEFVVWRFFVLRRMLFVARGLMLTWGFLWTVILPQDVADPFGLDNLLSEAHKK